MHFPATSEEGQAKRILGALRLFVSAAWRMKNGGMKKNTRYGNRKVQGCNQIASRMAYGVGMNHQVSLSLPWQPPQARPQSPAGTQR